MTIKDVVYRVVHGYPGGVPAMAARMAISKHVLQNKVNPNNHTHHTNEEELEQIQAYADSDEIAKEFALQRGMICIRMPTFDGVPDAELLDLFLTLDKERGDLARAVQKSLADGVIDPKEFQHIDEQFREYMAASAELMSRLSSMVHERRRVARVVAA